MTARNFWTIGLDHMYIKCWSKNEFLMILMKLRLDFNLQVFLNILEYSFLFMGKGKRWLKIIYNIKSKVLCLLNKYGNNISNHTQNIQQNIFKNLIRKRLLRGIHWNQENWNSKGLLSLITSIITQLNTFFQFNNDLDIAI